eukprot:6179537-Pleurochrysis_carterae.AAC.1
MPRRSHAHSVDILESLIAQAAGYLCRCLCLPLGEPRLAACHFDRAGGAVSRADHRGTPSGKLAFPPSHNHVYQHEAGLPCLCRLASFSIKKL